MAGPTLNNILRGEGINSVLITTPPHAVQSMGLRLERGQGVRWVVDLRDDWATNHRQRWLTPLHKRCAVHMEQKVVASATTVVLCTEVVRHRFILRYPDSRRKFELITLGFDEEDFAGQLAPSFNKQGDTVRLFYGGSSYQDFLPARFLALAKQFEALGGAGDWELVTAGAGNWEGAGYKKFWRHLGNLPHEQVSKEMLASNLLILAMPPGEREPSGTVPLKAYSYLRSGRTIVYVGERGATSDLLAPYAGTYVMARSDWPKLAEWCLRHRNECMAWYERPGLEQYGFAAIAKRYCDLFWQ